MALPDFLDKLINGAFFNEKSSVDELNLEVLLHDVLRDGDLLLVSDQFVDEAHVLRVQGVQQGARTGLGGG